MKKGRIYNIFSNIPTIETERCILRRMNLSDAEDMFIYASDKQVTKYLRWSPHPDIYYTSDYLRFISKKYKNGEFYDWGVVDKESGRFIGTCGFTRIDEENKACEVGYVLNPEFWNRGIASEVLSRVIKFAFEELALNRVECRYMSENIASRKVMEKCHMTYEGMHKSMLYVKGQFRDIGYCAILKSEYEKLQK